MSEHLNRKALKKRKSKENETLINVKNILPFVSLNLNKDTSQLLCGSGSDDNFSHNEVEQTMKSLLQKYWERPNELENILLHQLYLKYRFYNSGWSIYKNENIIHIWPQPSPECNGSYWEDFCYIKVLLHQHIMKIDNDLTDLLDSSVNNVEAEFSNKNDDQLDDEEYENEI
ncbi:26722_t:CDS:2 [Racocetra persica]|uniref:26722_t:CDS:1 n=1 Tax=Racocetra persica TaxID=160502 RepID=A0ACA9L762_9GLOM|nr:26722_t:CDS:2 [Racocetra persica]